MTVFAEYFNFTEMHIRIVIPKYSELAVLYRGADKFLAIPGRKQAQNHVRDARDFNNIETRAVIKYFPCKARRRRKFTPF